MGAVVGVLVFAIAVTALVLGSVATYRANHAIHLTSVASASFGGGSSAGTVTLTGTQTLTNKTLTAPIITRVATGGAAPTVALVGGATVVPPSMGSGSTDMAGYILCNGTNSGTTAFSIVVTFSAAYSAGHPVAVLVNAINADIAQIGPVAVTWNTTSFTIDYATPANPVPAVALVPYWTYLVVA